jgi:two-component system sensor histidine kinase KdpD
MFVAVVDEDRGKPAEQCRSKDNVVGNFISGHVVHLDLKSPGRSRHYDGLQLTSQVGGYVAGIAALVLITSFYRRDYLSFKATTIVLTYLLAILIASAIWGLGVSIFMSVAAAMCVDYFFLPPVGTFNINDPQDWVALVSFLITAVIGSDLSARARRQAQEATRQRNEVNRLYQFSQRLLSARNPLEMLNKIPS